MNFFHAYEPRRALLLKGLYVYRLDRDDAIPSLEQGGNPTLFYRILAWTGRLDDIGAFGHFENEE
jgi:hypothetical protein